MIDNTMRTMNVARRTRSLGLSAVATAMLAMPAIAGAQTTLMQMTFDEVAGTSIASFDLDPVADLDMNGFPDGDGIFETASTVDATGNGHRFLGFGGSSGWTTPGTRLDAVTTDGSGLLSVAHNSNTLDNGRMSLNTPVNGLAGGFDSGTATIIIDSWDFSNPIGTGNDPEQIRFGFGHESSTNSAAQVQITRSPFGLELRADTAGDGDVTGIAPVEMAAGVQVAGLVSTAPLSVSITLDEITDTFRLDYQILDGVSAPVALFTGGIPGDIREDAFDTCTGGCPGPFDPDQKRSGYHLRLAFDGNFSDDTFLIDEVLVTGTGGDLAGDLDGDGFVGINDLNIVLGAWNQNVPPANPLADPSGDGFVGIDDLNAVLGNWNAGTPPAAGAAIPEPASLALLGLGGLALLRRRA